jgi:Phage integrase family
MEPDLAGPDHRAARKEKTDPTFPRITVHALRHTAAPLAISARANVKAVQRMLGHESVAITLDVYADLLDDDLSGVASGGGVLSCSSSAPKLCWPGGAPRQVGSVRLASRRSRLAVAGHGSGSG